MFKLIGWVIKVSIFAVVVLIVGQVFRWNGKTVSDQIKTGLSHAEKIGSQAKLPQIDTDDVGARVKKAFDFSGSTSTKSHKKKEPTSSLRQAPHEEKIPSTDKIELKALLDQAEKESS